MRSHFVLALSLFAGLAIRSALAPFTGHPLDVYVWLKAAELFINGYWNVYTVSEIPHFPWGFYSYPPVWLLILVSSYVLAGPQSAQLNYAVGAVKAPIILADVLVALWIYRLSKVIGLKDEKALALAAAYALNPVAIFITGVWGMFDPLAVLFALMALDALIRGNKGLSGALLGVGIATKIFPVLLLPATVLYIKNVHNRNAPSAIATHLIPVFSVPLVFSMPFLLDSPSSYVGKLLFHTNNVGQFTYWSLIYPFIGREATLAMSLILFAVFYVKVISKYARARVSDGATLLRCSTAMIAIFLACSTKVNVQYLLWLMPTAFIVAATDVGEMRRRLWTSITILNVAAVLFLLYFLNMSDFSLSSLGRISPASPAEIGVAGAFLSTSALFAGWQFFRWGLFEAFGREFNAELVKRFGITSMIIFMIAAALVVPAPGGVNLSCDADRLAVVEGPDSFFLRNGEPDLRLLKRMGEPTVVAIPFGLDLFVLYNGNQNLKLDQHVKFRYGHGEWDLERLASSIRSLKRLGIKTLLGIYAYPGYPLVSYGILGFTTTTTESYFPWAFKDGSIDFSAGLNDRYKTLAEYVAMKSVTLARDLGFDGVYVLTEYKYQNGLWGYNPTVFELLKELRQRLGEEALLVFDGVDPLTWQKAEVDRAIELADIVVLRTSPWMRKLKSNYLEDVQLTRMLEEVRSLLRESDPRKFAYTLYVIDFAEGWIVPGIQVQAETEAFGELIDSCVITHASIYLPYRLTRS
ncbi:MAG: glycosyltransferase 87 family protein [Thaumarchaeota archaeon]|nr:glycosyltransferase 87 family protein [Candidatus Calditenuaceae archaeon]MDW8187097.1 glycosyltransferase 87 family protein [Nitrososphaerota archaeon]